MAYDSRLTVQAIPSSTFFSAYKTTVTDVGAEIGEDVEVAVLSRGENELIEAPIEVQVGKKRRGRPPRNPAAAAVVMTVAESKRRKKLVKEEKEDEDVCFICFDGGSLVLCDHRDCPKAYHPACVKRDESYFIPSIRWECGWHLCNFCQRNAIFLCYTCPYSLCKGCVKQADIFCVRGNKGFCKTCMSTIMLIEKIPQDDNELPQVDFDDATCWEYLFKVYWILLKNKEALAVDELIRASNPWKAAELEQKTRDTYFSNNSAHLAANTSKRRKTRKPQPPLIMDSQKIVKTGSNKMPGLLGRPDWASKELLEFVAYMKNGDVSSLPEFDVHALLLDYIKNNNLYDPRQKCQIICDKRLESLFGKERVGHFEMLKLLEYHFKEESSSNGVIPGAGLSGLVEEGTTVDIQTSCRNTRQQSRINGEEGDRRVDPKAYAAINAHNINLIYLKRSLLETLTVDTEKFHDKVVGSVVRIKLSNNDQKQDMHRLVRIIGSSKAAQPYKIGDKMENFMLKILNLNKIEDVRIDAISDQEFSEDECRRLRQSIKLGLVERMTVGEIQEKAMVLQAVRVSDRLETEIRRLNHLRDRASEMGRQKELRELVEKIELLRAPEECQRRIDRILEVHADPRMDPSCGSDDESGESDMKRRDVALTPKYSKSMESISPCRVGDKSKDDRARTLKAAAANGERKRKYANKFHVGEGASGSLEPPQKTERPDVASRVLERDSRTDSSVISQCNSDPSRATLKGMLGASDVSELEKIWYYQDPLGKVQGPFCMLQLRKWDSSDFFPNDLKVWRMNETCDQSILLKEALKKPQSSEPNFVLRSCLQSHDGKVNSIGVMNSNSVTSWVSDQTNEECSKSNMTDTACTLEQTVNGYSSQFLKAQLIDSLFNIEEPGSDSTAERSPETMHVNPKSEPPRPSYYVPMSANVDVASPAVNSGSPSPNVGRPGSETILDIASERNLATDLPGSMPVSNPENTKDLHADGQLHDNSDASKDFNVSCGTEAVAIKISDLPVSLPKTHIKDNNDHDNTVSGGTNVFFLSSAAPKGENDRMKCHEAENRHSISLDVPEGNSGSFVSGGMDVSLLPRTTPNKEIKANAVEVSGTPWISISGGITVSDLPNISSNSETDGLKTSIAGSNGFLTPNIPGQDSGISWSDMTMTGGMGFSVNTSTPMKLEIDASIGVAVENNQQEFNMSWTNPSSIGTEIDLLDIGNDWDWQPLEFNTLGDDSVSDLLSEVEAMEALRGMTSPVAADDSIGSPGDDCFNPLGGLNLNLDLGKNDTAFTASFNIDVSDIPGTSGILSTLGPVVETLSNPVTASLPPQTPVPDLNFVSQAPMPLSLTSSPLASPPLPTPVSLTPPPAVSKSPLPPPAVLKFPSSPLSSPQLFPAPTAAKTHSSSPQQSPLPLPLSLPQLSPAPTSVNSHSPPLQQSHLPPPAALKLPSSTLSSPQLPPVLTSAKPHSPPLQQAPLPTPATLKLPSPALSSPQLPPAPTTAKPHSPSLQQSPLLPSTALKLPSPPLSSPQLPPAPTVAKPHSPPLQQSPLPPPAALKLPPPPLSSPQLPPASTAAKLHSLPPQQPPLQPPTAFKLPSSPISPPQLPLARTIAKPHSPSPQQPPAVEKSPSPQPSILRQHCSPNPKEGRLEPTSTPTHEGVKRTAASVEFSWKQGSETTTSGKFPGTGSILGSPNINRTTSGQVTTPAVWANSPQGTPMVTSPRYNHNVGRQPGPKDRVHQYNNNVTDSAFGKSRGTSWNKQPSFGGRGGGPLRPGQGPPHRSQQRVVCKFYETGRCKKGAACSFLHP